jgi:nucleoid DNA-binding protein
MPTKIAATVAAKSQKAQQKEHRFSVDFLNEVAVQSRLPTSEVKKVMEGILKVVTLGLKEKSAIRLPNMVQFRLKEMKARPVTKRNMFGVERTLPARGETRKLKATVLKNLRDALRA